MKYFLMTLAVCVMTSPAFAGNRAVPEIDGMLALQITALIGGLALLVKKTKK
jgi:hypothetical protein